MDSLVAQTVTLALALTVGSGALEILAGAMAELHAQARAGRQVGSASTTVHSACFMEQP